MTSDEQQGRTKKRGRFNVRAGAGRGQGFLMAFVMSWRIDRVRRRVVVRVQVMMKMRALMS